MKLKNKSNCNNNWHENIFYVEQKLNKLSKNGCETWLTVILHIGIYHPFLLAQCNRNEKRKT